MHTISEQKIQRYFQLTKEAFTKAQASDNRLPQLNEEREDFLDMIERYITDADYFEKKGERINAFAALNYAHGWLDAGARLGLFDVHDAHLFTAE